MDPARLARAKTFWRIANSRVTQRSRLKAKHDDAAQRGSHLWINGVPEFIGVIIGGAEMPRKFGSDISNSMAIVEAS